MTGHGYRKLMRLEMPLRYVVEHVPPPQPVFPFIQDKTGKDDRQMYSTHNMGAVAAFIFDPADEERAGEVAEAQGWDLRYGGYVEKAPNKEVVLEEFDIRFESKELNIR